MYYLPDAERTKRMTTEELRQHFLVDNLFVDGAVTLHLASIDRVIVGGIVPTVAPLELAATEELAAEAFAERREVGLLNIGAPGEVVVDGAGGPLPT